MPPLPEKTPGRPGRLQPVNNLPLRESIENLPVHGSIEDLSLPGSVEHLPPGRGQGEGQGRDKTVRVSAVIITHNDAKNIRRTLAQLTWCDEIIIVDGFSTDDTVAICKAFKCTVYLKRFEGDGAQKQYGVSKASNDWILSIDANEVLSDAMRIEILLALRTDSGHKGYLLARSLVFFDVEFLYGKESWRYFLRLFNKRYGNFTDCAVDPKVKLKGPVSKLHHRIFYYGPADLFQFEEKCARYTTHAALTAVAEKRSWPLVLIILSLPLYFLKYYVLDLNFLNGTEGFYWSILGTYSHFSKYVKIRTLAKSQVRATPKRGPTLSPA